jgi:hypothetical protein
VCSTVTDISEPEGGVHIKHLAGDIEADFLVLFICSRARGFMSSRAVSSRFCGAMALPDNTGNGSLLLQLGASSVLFVRDRVLLGKGSGKDADGLDVEVSVVCSIDDSGSIFELASFIKSRIMVDRRIVHQVS